LNSLASLFENLDAEHISAAAQNYWIIPAGMLALYFYGVSHFNTPEYRLVLLQSPDSAALLTLAPPKYTTTRARFRRYARWYVLLLECAFLAFVFFTAIFSNFTHLLINASLEETGTLQSKAIFALFFLTGLLSSFPGFKDLDAWILMKLHRTALIPDQAKFLASKLFDAKYSPSKNIREQVRHILRSRDTIRYSEGQVTGALERRVLSTLWLHAQLLEKTKESERAYFTSKFEIDLTDVEKNSSRIRTELLSYFREQEKLVPAAIEDIDQYLDENAENDDIESLLTLRKDFLERCEGLYRRMCLLMSLLAYSTESTAEEIDGFLKKLGFDIDVQDTPIMDWDAVFRVVISVFVLMLAVNATFMGIYFMVGGPSNFAPDRTRLLIFALSTTLQYFIVVYAALKIKRHWRQIDRRQTRPENAMVAIFCYVLTLPVAIAISFYVRREFSIAPFLFVAIQGVAGYFIGTYIDRSLSGQPMSWPLARIQGACQFMAALLIFFFTPPPTGVEYTPLQQFTYATFFAFQSGLAGFLVGNLFQYYYRRTAIVPGQALGDITVQVKPAT
jgi:uncharacterized membrane protein YidH (DUF202 family)